MLAVYICIYSSICLYSQCATVHKNTVLTISVFIFLTFHHGPWLKKSDQLIKINNKLYCFAFSAATFGLPRFDPRESPISFPTLVDWLSHVSVSFTGTSTVIRKWTRVPGRRPPPPPRRNLCSGLAWRWRRTTVGWTGWFHTPDLIHQKKENSFERAINVTWAGWKVWDPWEGGKKKKKKPMGQSILKAILYSLGTFGFGQIKR